MHNPLIVILDAQERTGSEPGIGKSIGIICMKFRLRLYQIYMFIMSVMKIDLTPD